MDRSYPADLSGLADADVERFHDQVGQQFTAGNLGRFMGSCFTVGFNFQLDVFSDAHIPDVVQPDGGHAVAHGFTLRIQQSFQWHDVDVRNELHRAKVHLSQELVRLTTIRVAGT